MLACKWLWYWFAGEPVRQCQSGLQGRWFLRPGSREAESGLAAERPRHLITRVSASTPKFSRRSRIDCEALCPKRQNKQAAIHADCLKPGFRLRLYPERRVLN
jgi:hypothetical protein